MTQARAQTSAIGERSQVFPSLVRGGVIASDEPAAERIATCVVRHPRE